MKSQSEPINKSRVNHVWKISFATDIVGPSQCEARATLKKLLYPPIEDIDRFIFEWFKFERVVKQ